MLIFSYYINLQQSQVVQVSPEEKVQYLAYLDEEISFAEEGDIFDEESVSAIEEYFL